MTDTPEALADFRLVVAWPVQWGDQDAYGHLNNTIYFRYFETARIKYLERIGVADLFERERIGPILASIRCDFRRQVKYPDTMLIGTRATRIGRSSIGIEHRMVSEQNGQLVAEGDSTLVVFDYNTQSSHPVPAEVRAAIETLEGRSY